MAEKLDPKEIVTPWPSSYMTPRLHWAPVSPIPLRDGTLSGQPRSRHGCRHPSLPESQPRRWIFRNSEASFSKFWATSWCSGLNAYSRSATAGERTSRLRRTGFGPSGAQRDHFSSLWVP